MLKSMTGFGRCEQVTDQYKISVEMKAVNHRYLDLGIRMPKKFGRFENAVRSLLKEYVKRGKVDLFVSFEDYTDGEMRVRYNQKLAAEYVDCFQKMAEAFGLANNMTVSDLARLPEVLTMEQAPEDEEKLWEILSGALSEAASEPGSAHGRQRASICGRTFWRSFPIWRSWSPS